MNQINMVKYILVNAFIAFFWAFIGGLIISFNGKTHEAIIDGTLVFFVGDIVSIFVLGRLIKKRKISWFINGGRD